MKKRIFMSLILSVALLFSTFGALAVGEESVIPEIPYSNEQLSGVTAYWYEEMKYMAESEAAAENIPEGYTGDVLMLHSTDGGHVGIMLDVTDYAVKHSDVESVTFRIYCSDNTKEFRITDNGGKDWIARVAPEKTSAWIDVTVSRDGENIYAGKSFDNFNDENGYFKAVNVGFRFTDSADSTVYIDSITFNMRGSDKEAPVISYDGEAVINTTAGKALRLDATAYDEYDKADITPEYIYSEGAIDENGLLLEGEHTCTVKFTDAAGNASTIELTLKVEPKDVTAPVLNWAPDKIFANGGMMPVLNITATDDRDGEIDVTLTWSEDAVIRGRFSIGEHTLTVTAVDSTGNKTEKVIPVIVTSGLPNID